MARNWSRRVPASIRRRPEVIEADRAHLQKIVFNLTLTNGVMERALTAIHESRELLQSIPSRSAQRPAIEPDGRE